jgi:hypothetical protein
VHKLCKSPLYAALEFAFSIHPSALTQKKIKMFTGNFHFFSATRNLYGNRIQRIPFGTFDNMSSLKTLRLDSNLLECDCSVMWLVKHLKATKHHLSASANCKSPEIMEGRNLADMSEAEFHCS